MKKLIQLFQFIKSHIFEGFKRASLNQQLRVMGVKKKAIFKSGSEYLDVSNKIVNGDDNQVMGDNNIIIGDNNIMYGDNNICLGNNNRIERGSDNQLISYSDEDFWQSQREMMNRMSIMMGNINMG
jgi:hypothetical protein